MTQTQKALDSLKDLWDVLSCGMMENPAAAGIVKDILNNGFGVGVELTLRLQPPFGESEGFDDLRRRLRKAIKIATRRSRKVAEVYKDAAAMGITMRCDIEVTEGVFGETDEQQEVRMAVVIPIEEETPSQTAVLVSEPEWESSVRDLEALARAFTAGRARGLRETH